MNSRKNRTRDHVASYLEPQHGPIRPCRLQMLRLLRSSQPYPPLRVSQAEPSGCVDLEEPLQVCITWHIAISNRPFSLCMVVDEAPNLYG